MEQTKTNGDDMTTGFNKYEDKRVATDLAALLDDMWGYHMDTVFKVKKVGGVYRVFFKPTDEFDADWDLICPRMIPN
tara:strand:- start:720 stop:950 length:231 start_codon:yes stop_codon:yes gene_type:complete